MKALSIKQPWAYLIAADIKDVENRSWPTKYRGKILIHSSQKIDARFRAMNFLFTIPQWNVLSLNTRNRMVCGIFDHSAIIGEVEIIDCISNSQSVWAEPNQWHWILKNPVLYEKPVRNVKGKLMFWEFDNALLTHSKGSAVT